jgi:hypothetical protein
MVLVCKRFACDDVPEYFIDLPFEDVIRSQSGLAKTLSEGEVYATPKDENIAQCDIGMPLIGFLVVEFNDDGEPIRSEVVPVTNSDDRQTIRDFIT